MNPGELLKDWLRTRDKRKEELAARMKISVATIDKILAGKPVGYPTIIALSHITGIEERALAGSKPRRAKAS